MFETNGCAVGLSQQGQRWRWGVCQSQYRFRLAPKKLQIRCIFLPFLFKASVRLHFHSLLSHLPMTYYSYLCDVSLFSVLILNVFLIMFPLSPNPPLLCQAAFDEQWFPAHWFVGCSGVNCVVLRILPWQDGWGRGWWDKWDKKRGSGDKEDGAETERTVLSRGRCFFKSIFSQADSSGHWSGKKKAIWVPRETCVSAAFQPDAEW